MSCNPPDPQWGQQPPNWDGQPPQDGQFPNQQPNVLFTSQHGGYRPQYQEPGQAGLALGLGIGSLASFLPCTILVPFLGGAAWYLGHVEGKAIKAGLRDPSGQGQAKAGMIMGIISVALFFPMIVAYILFFVVLAASST